MRISDYIGEATEYDKKEMLEERRPKSWLKSVSAFANGLGGVLIYNVPIEEVLIGPEKVSFEREKVLFAQDNLSIQNAIDGLDSAKATKEKARLLFAQMEFNGIFGRSEIMSITGISITAAGNLITRLKKAGLIETVSGYGKGKYRFKKANG